MTETDGRTWIDDTDTDTVTNSGRVVHCHGHALPVPAIGHGPSTPCPRCGSVYATDDTGPEVGASVYPVTGYGLDELEPHHDGLSVDDTDGRDGVTVDDGRTITPWPSWPVAAAIVDMADVMRHSRHHEWIDHVTVSCTLCAHTVHVVTPSDVDTETVHAWMVHVVHELSGHPCPSCHWTDGGWTHPDDMTWTVTHDDGRTETTMTDTTRRTR